MAVVPVHRIHAAFGPSFAPSAPISPAQAHAFTHLPNVSVAASRARAAPLSVLSARAAMASASRSSSSIPVARAYPVSTRRAPPPPPRRRASVVLSYDDPFADGPLELVRVLPRVSEPEPLPLIASRTRIPAPTSHQPPSPAEMDITETEQASSVSTLTALPPGLLPEPPAYKDTRGRLVASVLLSRRCGRPLRRRLSTMAEGRSYVKSGLSRMVEIEA